MISWKCPLSGTCWNPGEHSFCLAADTLSARVQSCAAKCHGSWSQVAVLSNTTLMKVFGVAGQVPLPLTITLEVALVSQP